MNKPIVFNYTGFWKRFLAFFVDAVVLVLVYCSVIYLVNRILGLPVEYSPIYERGISIKMTKYAEDNFVSLVLLYSAIKLSMVYPYFALMESSRWQGTLGKALVRSKVVDSMGRRISFGRATGRFFGKILSSQTLLIGYLMVAFTKKKQALHDLLAGTFVVNNEATQVPVPLE
jgi:uncharacterized RDD family membrane protein YckC